MDRRRTLLLTALAGTPLIGGLTSIPASAAATNAAAKAHTYKGTTVNTTWGPMQVVITVKGKKITRVKVNDPTHTARSQVLVNRAIPILVQETLSAQSARINYPNELVTMTNANYKTLSHPGSLFNSGQSFYHYFDACG